MLLMKVIDGLRLNPGARDRLSFARIISKANGKPSAESKRFKVKLLVD